MTKPAPETSDFPRPTGGLRVLVCGGRDYADRATFDRWMAPLRTRAVSIITGCASGADTLALGWAQTWGIHLDFYPADWKKHGKAAGPIRNRQMLEMGRPDLVIAFPGGRGTADMIRQAEAAGVEVRKVTS